MPQRERLHEKEGSRSSNNTTIQAVQWRTPAMPLYRLASLWLRTCGEVRWQGIPNSRSFGGALRVPKATGT
ncbi:MAG TPA: hypothetical protein VIH59_34155, partial [Candidatus Tectomicrobia bacterium]